MRVVAVTEADVERLTCLLQVHGARAGGPRTLPVLQKKLEDAEVLDAGQIPPDVVTMNSRVLLRNLDSAEEIVHTLTFPGGANPEQGRVSILSSIGIAMLGHKAGDVLECGASEGVKRFRVMKVLYQPEAANDDG